MSTSFVLAYQKAADKARFWYEHPSLQHMRSFIDEVMVEPLRIPRADNPIMMTDSYKLTQFNMFNDAEPDEDGNMQRLTNMYAFIEPRKGARDPQVIVAGTAAIADKLAYIRVTMQHVMEAVHFCAAHFSTPDHDGRYHFNPLPWLKVVLEHHGCLPFRLSALPEGMIVPIATPICVIESTDEDCAQLVSHFEGLIQKAYWYPTTVATNALGFSSQIKRALQITTTSEIMNGWLPFSLQDFGYRGTTSEEAAVIGGSAAMYVTMGSDTVPAITHTMSTLGVRNLITGVFMMAAYSVAACEHNQAFSRGKDGEFRFIKNLLKVYPTGLLSVVADTYDMRHHIETITTGKIRDLIMARNGTYIIRPDSQFLDDDGKEMSPAETVSEIFKILGKNLAEFITVNEKGFRVLPNKYKIIYGDGLSISKIKSILDMMIADGWCATNIVFGVGGNLLQNINRDTFRFAMKSSQQEYEITNVDGSVWKEIRNVGKETPGKQSKKGRFHVSMIDGKIECNDIDDPRVADIPNMLERYYQNGNVCKSVGTIDEIRARVNAGREMYDL
jgi:nicotinamide phosphoribosyltransferase